MRRARRRRDLAIGVAIAVIIGAAVIVLWRGGDAAATSLSTAPSGPVPAPGSSQRAAPAAVHEIWTLTTDPALGAVVSPYGSVVTTDGHTVTAHSPDTGSTLWTYRRSNVPLCAIGSAATTDTGSADYAGSGIVTGYAKNGWCSQVAEFDPTTGARIRDRTSPNREPGRLIFGGSYTGWVGPDLLELWRSDFVRTIQYGNQPNPVNSDGPHTGCTFSDMAVADQQFATVEHCAAQPGVARLAINYDDPKSINKQWDAMHSSPRATIDTGSPVALLVGISPDRVAILVTSPAPAFVVYDATGTEVSRTQVDIPAAQISAAAAAGITPSDTIDTRRYTLVGDRLLSVSLPKVDAPAPAPTSVSSRPSATDATGTIGPSATVVVQSPHLDWIHRGVLGLPTRIAADIIAPVANGLVALGVADGRTGRTISVERGPYRGRIDVTAVGTVIVEVRGGTVVGYSPTG